MELDELRARLKPFCEARYSTRELEIFDVHPMPGHAGFAYGFSVRHGVRTAGATESWFIRLPPPNVNWRGTADVLRQVAALNALEGTGVPHCRVRWSGDDLEWFGRPYFVVPKLTGDVLRIAPGEWAAALSDDARLSLGRQAMRALAEIHAVDVAKVPYLGEPLPLADDVARWDRFYERAADPELLRDVPKCRQKLLDTLPADATVGLFHGDFQPSNLFCSPQGKLLAVIDWELTGIGATPNDLGWLCTFCDRHAWSAESGRYMFLDPPTLIGLYEEASGSVPGDVNWFRALAAYKFAIITGFNLGLHRRGKRVDPTWEQTRLSMTPLVNRALELLGA